MLIVTAVNITEASDLADKDILSRLQDKDGKSKYDVWIGINQHCIWRGTVQDHVRDEGAAALLRHIATAMENSAGQTVPE